LNKKINFFWSQDVPNSFFGEPQENFFENKCLIICTILGLLQNKFFEDKKHKKFQTIQSINSTNNKKQHLAGHIIVEEFFKIIEMTNLPETGPYELESTCRILSTVFNCQFIIFNSVVNANRILYMYPETYADELQPIYIYQPNIEKNHLVYIKNVPSFFKNNFRVCLSCQKIFHQRTSKIPLHLCPKRPTCFACRRFYMTNYTYINDNLKHNFCNKLVTLETSFNCQNCNVTIYSSHCLAKHKIFCGPSGRFGFKCLKCKKNSYRRGKCNTSELKKLHKCENMKPCSTCFE
jgi:hypothetical protein